MAELFKLHQKEIDELWMDGLQNLECEPRPMELLL